MGRAIDTGQWRRGVTTVGAPIVDDERISQFGITESIFTDQHDHVMLQGICEEIRAVAHYASQRAYGSAIEPVDPPGKQEPRLKAPGGLPDPPEPGPAVLGRPAQERRGMPS